MSRAKIKVLLRHLGWGAPAPGPEGGAPTDRLLLQRFADGDQQAFALLLERHGPMVLGVCRRILRHEQDAEDAFQAAFLVLAKKARDLSWRESVGPWLHEVACRVSRKARAGVARRLVREGEMNDRPASGTPDDTLYAGELRDVLDEELRALPARYRAPVVLCYLEGMSNAEAARELGWTKGTVSGRLARARDALRRRLARRGMALSVPAVGALLDSRSLSAAPSAALTQSTLEAATAVSSGTASAGAAALAEVVLREMARARILTLVAVALVGLAGAGAGLWAYAFPAKPPPRVAAPAAADKPAGEKARAERPAPVPVWQESKVDLKTPKNEAAWGLAFSPDGTTLAMALAEGDVRLVDPATGKEQARLSGHQAQVTAVAWSPDGKRLAAGCDSGSFWLWDVPQRKLKYCNLLAGRNQQWCLLFSPDGKTLIASNFDQNVTLWDVEKGEVKETFKQHTGQVTSLTPVKGGELVASTAGLEVLVWDPKTLRVKVRHDRRTFERFEDVPDFQAVSPDGALAAEKHGRALDADRVSVWDLTTGKKKLDLPPQPEPVCGLAFSPDGRLLATGGQRGAVRLWDAATGKQVHTFDDTEHVPFHLPLAFSPDGKKLAAGVWLPRLLVCEPKASDK